MPDVIRNGALVWEPNQAADTRQPVEAVEVVDPKPATAPAKETKTVKSRRGR